MIELPEELEARYDFLVEKYELGDEPEKVMEVLLDFFRDHDGEKKVDIAKYKQNNLEPILTKLKEFFAKESAGSCDGNCEHCKYYYKLQDEHVFTEKYIKYIENHGFDFEFEGSCHISNISRYINYVINEF